MKVERFRYLLLGGALLLVTLVPVSTAIAAEPVMFTNQFEFTDVFDCGAFLAIEESVQVNRVTIFFDNEGNPVSRQNHIQFRGIITNSVTGKSEVDRADLTVFIDFVEGTVTFAGKTFLLTAPEEGIVAQDAGKIVFDADGNVTFVAGTHDLFLGDLGAGVCAAVD